MKSIRTKVEHLLAALGQGVYERDEAIALSFLSAASGESIFLLGLPGVAKSMIARRLAMAFKNARRFEYLMSRFSTPDEIFGPVSISKLKDEDTYERVVEGYLPTADVIFLDEIWKAGPAIQNSLLTALNERLFHNGQRDIMLPAKCVIAASNELPAEGEGLEALWDRFLFRYIIEPLYDKCNFFALIAGRSTVASNVATDIQFSSSEMSDILNNREEIDIPPAILDFLFALRKRYASLAIQQMRERAETTSGSDKEEEESISYPYISDRRWKKIAGILRTSALLNDRKAVDWSDCLLLEHLIWDKDSQIAMVRSDISSEIITAAMKPFMIERSGGWTTKPSQDSYWLSEDGVHYGIDVNGETMLIRISDYDNLEAENVPGRFTGDNIISTSLSIRPDADPAFLVRKTKPGTLTINNYTYHLKRASGLGETVSSSVVVQSSASAIADIATSIENNLFTRSYSSYKELERGLRLYQKGSV